MPRPIRSLFAWGYGFLLAYLLLMPSPLAPLGGFGAGTEKVVDRTLSSYGQHVAAYMILVWMLWWGFSPRTPKTSWGLAGAAILHGSVFEGLQFFVPSRESDWQDLFCNLLGVGLGWVILRIVTDWRSILRSVLSSKREGSEVISPQVPFEGGK
jgi:VanZ family protein